MVVDRQDRRVQKTRRLFQEALIQLLQENRYTTISIEDLAEQANLGRTTFYLHYQDKDALLEECVIIVLSKLTEKIYSSLTTHWSPNDPRVTQLLFEFVCENEKFIKIMQLDPCGSVFFQGFQKIVMESLNQEVKNDFASPNMPPGIPLEFLSIFYTGAIMAVIEWWVDNEKPYSVAQMVEMISQAMGKSIR